MTIDLLLYHVALETSWLPIFFPSQAIKNSTSHTFIVVTHPGGLKNVMNLLSRLSASFALAPLSRQSRFIMTASIIDGKALAQ